ncbi:MAG: protein kinase domain-containing protein [Pyrinomonadaceae bacterium]
MNSQWQKIEEAIASLSEIPTREREMWLVEFCRDDETLKHEIESLLAFEQNAENFLEKSVSPYAAKVLPENETIFSGRQFGNYRTVREIGRGGMGAVFSAERADGEFEQQAALKIVRQTILDAETENRFRRERQILASLNHPNIARLLDGGVTENGEPFLVMEFIEGETLLEFAENQNLTIEERLKLFVKICSATAFAHRNLIVHRDIKPSNILVAADGAPKLLDFGLAKVLDFETDTAQTATAFRAMTPAYASPEQLRGGQVTTASDIYSLGVALYELLTGNRPFTPKTNSFEEIVRLISTSEPIRPSEAQTRRQKDTETNSHSAIRNPRLKGDLDNIILTSLRKEPERRYKSVEAFAGDIERHLNGLPVSARPNTFRYRAGKFIHRNKVGVIAASFIFLAIVSGLIISLWQADVARRQRDAANAEKLKAERINKFLQEMLSFSNQSGASLAPTAQKKNVTVNEMLDQIAPQIESELADQPEVHAQVLQTIGESYGSQGRYDSAEKYLREALEIQTRIYGDGHPESAYTGFLLGVLFFNQGKFDDAIPLLEKYVAVQRELQKSNSEDFKPAQLAFALNGIGTTQFSKGETQAGLANLNEALQIADGANLQGKQREVLASIQTNLGGALVRSGELEKGETLLRASLTEYRQISGSPRWEFGATLTMLGELLNGKNQPDEAEKFLTEGEQIYRQTLGDKNGYVGHNLNEQAIALNQKNDYQPAEEKARECLAIYQSVFPAGNPNPATPLATLGIILTKAGRAREGENYLRQSLAVSEAQRAKNFNLIVKTKIGLSECLLAQNRFAEAEKIALEAREEAAQNFGEQNPLAKTASDELTKAREKQSVAEIKIRK